MRRRSCDLSATATIWIGINVTVTRISVDAASQARNIDEKSRGGSTRK
jgi:hypothetical protein